MTQVQEQKRSDLLNLSRETRVMIVEDNLISRTFLEAQILQEGHTVVHAEHGLDAITKLTENPESVDVILMDREMPVMDGLTAVKRIKSEPKLRNMPVIMITGTDTDDAIDDGLNAGVFYYLTKPVKEEMLRSVLSAAVREVENREKVQTELSKHRAGFDLMTSFRFELKTLEHVNKLSGFIASCFPDPARVVTGVSELLVNAIEHGNLEIGYESKYTLLQANNWETEVQRRLLLPKYADRVVSASVVKKQDGIYLVVEDQGEGFDWKKYVRVDPSRAGDSHGRGIALAAMSSFDKLQYNEKGNKAVAIITQGDSLEW